MSSFLIGSTHLFEKIEALVRLLAGSIDVDVDFSYKLVGLETDNVSYDVELKIDYPKQPVFGHNLTKEQIDEWFRTGISLILKKNEHNSLIELANKTGINLYFIYVEIPEKTFTILLDDFKELSILLFKNLVLLEQ